MIYGKNQNFKHTIRIDRFSGQFEEKVINTAHYFYGWGSIWRKYVEEFKKDGICNTIEKKKF